MPDDKVPTPEQQLSMGLAVDLAWLLGGWDDRHVDALPEAHKRIEGIVAEFKFLRGVLKLHETNLVRMRRVRAELAEVKGAYAALRELLVRWESSPVVDGGVRPRSSLVTDTAKALSEVKP